MTIFYYLFPKKNQLSVFSSIEATSVPSRGKSCPAVSGAGTFPTGKQLLVLHLKVVETPFASRCHSNHSSVEHCRRTRAGGASERLSISARKLFIMNVSSVAVWCFDCNYSSLAFTSNIHTAFFFFCQACLK